MELLRTANAGILLRLDGVSILLDGVCGKVETFIPTPEPILKQLQADLPDVVAFTHEHVDHFHKGFADFYQKTTLRPILGPETLPLEQVVDGVFRYGCVRLQAIPTRHIGKASLQVPHRSHIIQGSKCVWFLGDASPLQIQNRTDLPHPDVLMVPFAYTTNTTGWEIVKQLNPSHVVLLHLPPQNEDPYGLWDLVAQYTGGTSAPPLWIPEIGETIRL